MKFFVRVLYLDAGYSNDHSGIQYPERFIGLFDSIEEMALWCRDYSAENPNRGFVLEAIRVIPESEKKK